MRPKRTKEQIEANNRASAEYKARKKDPALMEKYLQEKEERRRLAAEAFPESNRAYQREWARKQRESASDEDRAAKLAYRREWHAKNKERVALRKREFRKNPETKAKDAASAKRRREANPEKHKVLMAEWRRKNPDKIRASVRRRWEKERNDPICCVIRSVRSIIYFALKTQKGEKSLRTIQYIGCTPQVLKAHIESLFTNGMTWENRGRGGWEIDHKTPISAFDLSTE